MSGFKSRLNNFVSKISKSSLFEVSDWRSGFKSYEQLKQISKPDALDDCHRRLMATNIRGRLRILTSLIYMIQHGVEFTEEERVFIFFTVSRLYEYESRRVRRLTYYLMSLTMQDCEHMFMLQSLVKSDLNSENACTRACAIRMYIMLNGMSDEFFTQLETIFLSGNPYLLQVILTALYYRCRTDELLRETVKRKLTYLQLVRNQIEAEPMLGSCLILLYCRLFADDIRTLAQLLLQINASSDFVNQRLIAEVRRLIWQVGSALCETGLVEHMFGFADTGSDAVALEVIKLIAESLSNQLIPEAILFSGRLTLSKLARLFKKVLNSQETLIRYSALKLLYCLGTTYTQFASEVVMIIDPMAVDGNLAFLIQTLLTFMLCRKDISKRVLLSKIRSRMYELSETLCDELISGLLTVNELNQEIVDFLIDLIQYADREYTKLHAAMGLCVLCKKNNQNRPDIVANVIEVLCNLIEDCNDKDLLSYLLNFLASHIPNTSDARRHLGSILNRIILETGSVRAVSLDSSMQLYYLMKESRDDIKTMIFTADLNLKLEGFADVGRLIAAIDDYDESTSADSSEELSIVDLKLRKYTNKYINELELTNLNQLAVDCFDESQQIAPIELDHYIKSEGTQNEAITGHPNSSHDTCDRIITQLGHLITDFSPHSIDETSGPIVVSAACDDLSIQLSLAQCMRSMGCIILAIQVTNDLDYATLQNVRFEIAKSSEFMFDIEVEKDFTQIGANGQETNLLLLRPNCSEILPRNNQKLQLIYRYDCLEEGTVKAYPVEACSREIDISLIGMFKVDKFESTKCVNEEPKSAVKMRCNDSIDNIVAAINTYQFHFGYTITEDPETANKFGFGLIFTPSWEKMNVSMHFVAKQPHVLLKAEIFTENQNLADFFAQEIQCAFG